MAWPSSESVNSGFMMSNTLAWNDFLWCLGRVQPKCSALLLFWLQDTWLAPKREAAGFVFLSEGAHTFPFATWLALHKCEQMALHLPPSCQPTPWNKHKEDSHCKLCVREHKRRQSGHYCKKKTHWLSWFFICSTIKKVCLAFLDCSLFASMPLLQGNHESLFRIH